MFFFSFIIHMKLFPDQITWTRFWAKLGATWATTWASDLCWSWRRHIHEIRVTSKQRARLVAAASLRRRGT